jgi:glycosyltransferase involved in cell wall biosynthesis
MISIVIPLFNKAQTIKRSIESIQNQSFAEYEVLIVNDGSTDNSLDSAVEAIAEDDRFKIIEQSNQGVSVARNTGVKHSKYKYIAFLDGDDEWNSRYLEEMVNSTEAFPDAVMFCAAGVVKDEVTTHERIAEIYNNKTLQVDFFENPHVFFHISATVVKKEAFLNVNGFTPGMVANEDYELSFKLAMTGNVVYVGKKLCVYWGDDPNQATKRNRAKQEIHPDKIMRLLKIHNFAKQIEVSKNFYIFEAYEIRHIILSLLKSNNKLELKLFLNTIEKILPDIFSPAERSLYKSENMRFLSIILIYLTKVRWRMYRYPVLKY